MSQDRRAVQQLDRDILLCFDSLSQVALPSLKTIDCADNCVCIASQLGHRKLASPAIVAKRGHIDILPRCFAFFPEQEPRDHMVVAVGEDVGLDHDHIAHHPLDRKTPRIDLGSHPLNYNSLVTIRRLCHSRVSLFVAFLEAHTTIPFLKARDLQAERCARSRKDHQSPLRLNP